MYIHRRALLFCHALLLAGCMPIRPFDPKDLPPAVPLQDAPDGKAVVYLFRAPHDSTTVPVYFGERKVAVLPPSTYSLVMLDPGTYLVASSPAGRSDSAPASQLVVQSGERRFLYVSATTGNSFGAIGLPLGRAGIVPLLLPSYGSTGARTWKECNELDAQGFMSISRPVVPEPGAA